MDPKIKAMWVEALRSGEYQQCDGRLRMESEDGEKFCCLGVLTDLYFKANPDDPERSNWDNFAFVIEPSLKHGYERPDRVSDLLPIRVARWAGLPFTHDVGTGKTDVAVLVGNDNEFLADLNDNGSTFSEIARFIEEGL